MTRGKYGAVMVAMLMAFGAHADIAAAWDVNGVEVDIGQGIESSEPPYTFYATTAASGLNAQLSLGSGVNRSTSADQYGFKISNGTTSLSSAIEAEHYLQFTIFIEAGYTLNLSSIEMNGESTSAGCSSIALLSSIAGFTAGQEIEQTHNVNVDGFGNPIDLTDPNYAGLSGTTTFRLYGWNSTSGRGVTRIRNDIGNDLIINGTLTEAIPEPAALGLITLTGLGALGVKRFFLT